jgi:hypothetical protein
VPQLKPLPSSGRLVAHGGCPTPTEIAIAILFPVAFAILFVPPAVATDPPRVVRERIEWLDVWVPGNDVTG